MNKLIATLFLLVPSVCLADISGKWDVVGKGDNGVKWVADLELNVNMKKRRDNPEENDHSWLPPENYTGYFIWRGENGTGGKEYVSAHVDYKTGAVVLNGHTLENANPNIIQAVYNATLTKEQDRMNDGKWDGVGVIPGRWKAKRRAAK